jgi:hypothetical protein
MVMMKGAAIGTGSAPKRRPSSDRYLPQGHPSPSPVHACVTLGRAPVLRRRVGWGWGPWGRVLDGQCGI